MPLKKIDITTVINFKRTFTSNKAIMTVKAFLLKEEETQEFHEVPLHKR
jgi:hypothetical protein